MFMQKKKILIQENWILAKQNIVDILDIPEATSESTKLTVHDDVFPSKSA